MIYLSLPSISRGDRAPGGPSCAAASQVAGLFSEALAHVVGVMPTCLLHGVRGFPQPVLGPKGDESRQKLDCLSGPSLWPQKSRSLSSATFCSLDVAVAQTTVIQGMKFVPSL